MCHADARQKADVVLGSACDNGILGALHIFVSNGDARTQKEVALTPGSGLRPDDIKRHLVENEAQRKEVTGYINQLSIQLHRWQLRLQKLNERKTQLETELSLRAGE